MKQIIFISLLFVYMSGFSQSDTISNKYIKYTPKFKFADGIYLNINQFKNNNPISKSRIVTNLDSEDFDFFDRLLENEKITLYDKLGNQKEVEVRNIWGYSNKGIVHVNFNGEFNRIPVVGKICHFVSVYTYIDHSQPDMSYNNTAYYNNGVRRTELRQYLLDTETGKVYDFTVKAVEVLLMNDTKLYDEFNNLRRRKKRKLKFLYIRKYNTNNPLLIKTN